MKLTELSIDCLENILEYLDFLDLLNASTSNKRLNKAANFIFDRDYSEKLILYSIHCSQSSVYCITDGSLYLSNLKTVLQCIRCFGHLVSKIDFQTSTGWNRRRMFFQELDQYVLNYVNDYCSDTLTGVTINTLRGWMKLPKPFVKVQTVYLIGCDVIDMHTLNRLFPKMMKLVYSREFSGKSFFVGTNYCPNLKTLHINDYDCFSRSVFGGDTMAPILRLNPQLEDLHLNTSEPLLDSIDFRNALQTLSNLRKLSFDGGPLYTNPLNNIICLENVKIFQMDTLHYEALKIPFALAQLNKFDLMSWRLDDEFFRFIDKHPGIQELTLYANDVSAVDMSKIATSLPILKTIRVGIDDQLRTISGNEAMQYINMFQNVENFVFVLSASDAYDDFQANLSDEWQSEMDESGIVKVKRLCPLKT